MFESVFSWFDSLYSEGLGEYLAGYTLVEEPDVFDYANADLFNVSGIVALTSAALIATLFYYVWNPSSRMRLKWFLTFGITAVINFLVGFALPYSDLINDNVFLPEGLSFSGFDCLMFGFSDFIVSAAFFIIISYTIRWWSRNNKYIPF